MQTTLIIVMTALLSSALTAFFLYRAVKTKLLPELERALDRAAKEAANEIGNEVELRVKQGVTDAVANLPSREVIEGATRAATRTGAEILSQGLGRILNPGRRSD